MKTFVYISVITLAFPAIVFGAVGYSHSGNVSEVTTSMQVHMAIDDYDTDINCGGLQFWGVQVIEHISGKAFLGVPRLVPASTLSQSFTFQMPVGDYEEVTFICSDDGDNIAFQHGSIEKDLAGDQIIFSVLPVRTEVIAEAEIENASILGNIVDAFSSLLQDPQVRSVEEVTEIPATPATSTKHISIPEEITTQAIENLSATSTEEAIAATLPDIATSTVTTTF